MAFINPLMFKDSEIGLITETYDDGTKIEKPTYTCGHCNTLIVMDSQRVRPRKRCLRCAKLICEKTRLCREDCTPVAELAKDHLEGLIAKKFGAARLSAILGG